MGDMMPHYPHTQDECEEGIALWYYSHSANANEVLKGIGDTVWLLFMSEMACVYAGLCVYLCLCVCV